MQVIHIVGKEAHHQFLNLIFVVVVIGMYIHIDSDKLWLCLSFLRPCLCITIEHGNKLYRVNLFAIVVHFHVKKIRTDTYGQSCLNLLPKLHEHIAHVRIGYFIFAVFDDNIESILLSVDTDSRNHSVCYSSQKVVVGLKVNSMMKK